MSDELSLAGLRANRQYFKALANEAAEKTYKFVVEALEVKEQIEERENASSNLFEFVLQRSR